MGRIAPATLTALLLAACSGGASEAGLEEHLREVAAAHDEFYDEHGRYPGLARLGELVGEEVERWNLVAYYGGSFGYCLEGDDTEGTTWHLTRDADELTEGECPKSGGPVLDR